MAELMRAGETIDEYLDRAYWGWFEFDGWGWQLRRPLEPTESFPKAERTLYPKGWGAPPVRHLFPPYVSVGRDPRTGRVHVDLYQADGYRAGYDPARHDDSGCLYADEPEALPEPWRAAVAAAITEARERFPGARFQYRPDRDDPLLVVHEGG